MCRSFHQRNPPNHPIHHLLINPESIPRKSSPNIFQPPWPKNSRILMLFWCTQHGQTVRVGQTVRGQVTDSSGARSKKLRATAWVSAVLEINWECPSSTRSTGQENRDTMGYCCTVRSLFFLALHAACF